MKHTLPEGYLVRPARMDDAGAIVEMWNAWSNHTLGADKFTLQETQADWSTPGFDLSNDTRLVTAPGGEIAGYYEVWDIDEPHVRLHCWGLIHPEHTNLGIGSLLLAWAEERARQALDKAPAEVRVVLLAHGLSKEEAAMQLFRDAGFEFIRHSLRMVIRMNGQPPAAEWPKGITVRPMIVGKEERAVVHAIRDTFQDHWGYVESPFETEFEQWKHYMENDESYDPTLWFLAMDGEKIAGISLCRSEAYDDPEMGWVRTLGVRRPWRRRGIGLALLAHSFRAFHQLGKRKVGLGVDAKSLTGAKRLYEKAGMRSDPEHQYSIYEKELRPGVDLSLQTLDTKE